MTQMRYKQGRIVCKAVEKTPQILFQLYQCFLWFLCVQVFEVATNTRIRDLILNITNKLNLTSADGFSIFVKTEDKVYFAVCIFWSGFFGIHVFL